MQDTILTPSDFVALLNQTLEFAYPSVTLQGELSNFRVSKNRWVYFDLKDEFSSVAFFGVVYQLPGPLQDGLRVQVVGTPRMHPRFGFSINFLSISPIGEGSIKKASDMLKLKLEAEGLFAPERKRLLPQVPQTIGLITAESSAAYADFIKILNERWGGTQVWLADTYVQGQQAPGQILAAVEYFNQLKQMPDVLVLVRGGGSAEDLASFSDERVVRAVAASRIPTIVAIGHETDVSLAELAADQRASTPSNAAQIVVPDKKHILAVLNSQASGLSKMLKDQLSLQKKEVTVYKEAFSSVINQVLAEEKNKLAATKNLSKLLDPKAALKRGYAMVSAGHGYITKAAAAKMGDKLDITFYDGKIQATTTKVLKNG